MVVVPGITTPAGAFGFAAERLAAFAGDVYVLDMRGRGYSERSPSGTHRASDYAEDVLALVEDRGLEDPVLVGHSLGARVVAAARARFPGCASGVVAIDPPMSGPGRRPYPIPLDRFMTASTGPVPASASSRLGSTTRPGPTTRWPPAVQWLGSCDEVAVVESYSWFHLEAIPPVWTEVEPPALLLYGDESPVVTASDAAELGAANPRATLASVAHSGHMIPWDNLEETLQQIELFTTKLVIDTTHLTTNGPGGT